MAVTSLTDPAPVALGPRLPSVGGAAIAGVGASVPQRVVSSREIAARFGAEESWIVRRTGIHSRHIAAPEERLSDHAAAAAREALIRADASALEVDLVVVATITADHVAPSVAPVVAHELGMTLAGAFDVGAACSGFISALSIAAGQIEAGRAHCAVVIGADFMSRVTDPNDRPTAAVFADGAGAVVLVGTDERAVGPVVLGADGACADLIRIEHATRVVRMEGHETFRAAVDRLSQATLEAAAAAEVGLGEIDWFVYHQANGRILAAVAERLDLPLDRVIDCIGEYGNTSAATLPLALSFGEQHGLLGTGDRVLLAAFGAGFTWGAAVVEWGSS